METPKTFYRGERNDELEIVLFWCGVSAISIASIFVSVNPKDTSTNNVSSPAESILYENSQTVSPIKETSDIR